MWAFRRTSLVVIVISLANALILLSAAQSRDAWRFPSELRQELDSRIRLFTQAQADGRWEDVAQLLGEDRRGEFTHMSFTPSHKDCLISQMQKLPMIDFTFTVRESPYSSEILSTPPEKRWWVLTGEGLFREHSQTIQRNALITAYRDKGTWYFTPNYFNDEALAEAHLTAEDLARDYGSRVDLQLTKDSPLEIVDLHVFIDAKHVSSRRIQFRLHNKSSKKVIGYSFDISDERQDGSISVGTGAPKDAVEPDGVSRVWEEDHPAYSFWCEGEARIRIKITNVSFADGSTWDVPIMPTK